MANGYGGRREGAGRKPSAATVKTREIANVEAASGKLMPLTVILEAMRDFYDKGELYKAALVAVQAAPYCHPRLSAVAYLPAPDQHEEQPTREIIVSTREQAEALLPLVAEAGPLP